MVASLQKKITTLFLCIVVLQIIAPFIFSCSVANIRHQQKKLLAQEHSMLFTHIVIPETQQLAISLDSEIEYNGTLYDVKSTTKKNGKLLITAIPDKKESNILTKAAKSSSHHQYPFKYFAPFALLYYEAVPVFNITCPIFSVQQHFIHYQRSRYSAFAAVFLPPPRFNC